MSKLEKYFSQFEEKELEDNFSELVRKYNEKEKREPRNVESAFFYPIKVGSSVLFEASFQDYKNDIERRKSEGIEIQAIRDFYQKKVIDKFLSDKRLSEIYEKIKVGEPIKNPPFSNIIKKWSFWSNVHRVQDIIKLEKFLKELSLQQPENNKPNETKKENDKPDEVKKELYNHIFKGNAFEVWQSMFDSFQITESSRTDVKFMFEEMKKDGLIHNTVNQKTFLDWLSEPPYQITIQKTSNYSKTKERISIYSNAKQLYKS